MIEWLGVYGAMGRSILRSLGISLLTWLVALLYITGLFVVMIGPKALSIIIMVAAMLSWVPLCLLAMVGTFILSSRKDYVTQRLLFVAHAVFFCQLARQVPLMVEATQVKMILINSLTHFSAIAATFILINLVFGAAKINQRIKITLFALWMAVPAILALFTMPLLEASSIESLRLIVWAFKAGFEPWVWVSMDMVTAIAAFGIFSKIIAKPATASPLGK